jgi:hypothetical protein
MAVRFTVAHFCLLALFGAHLSAAPLGKEAKPSSERLRELQKERVKFLEEYWGGLATRGKLSGELVNNFIEAVRELGDAELDLAETREQRLAAHERMLKRLQDRENTIANLVAGGMENKHHLALVKAARIKAEIQLEKMKLSR